MEAYLHLVTWRPRLSVLEPSLMIVGVSFRTAPVSVRERFWVEPSRQKQILATLADSEGIEEAAVLATCERTEFLIWANDAGLAANSVLRLLSSEFSLQLCQWEHFYRLLDEDALVHVNRVAGGLDSVIYGDRQPRGKMIEALERAQQAGSAGTYLGLVIEKACSVSERVRSDPGLGWSGQSVASAAIEIARRLFGSLEDKRILIVGAGTMGELAAGCLANHGLTDQRILNRTFERAIEVAHKVGGTAVPFEDFGEEFARADVVIGCAATRAPLMNRSEALRVSQQRRGKPQCILDLGLPRNIDAKVRDVGGIVLYDLDDIRASILHGADLVKRTTVTAESIVDAEAKEFRRKLVGEHAVPTSLALRERLDQLCQRELEEFRRECGPFSKEEEHLMSELAGHITRRIATSLTRELKDVQEKTEQKHMTEAMNRLFHLDAGKEVVNR